MSLYDLCVSPPLLYLPSRAGPTRAHLVSRGSGLAGIVRPDQPRLVLVVRLGLAEREAALATHPLCRPDLLDRLLESGVSDHHSSCVV